MSILLAPMSLDFEKEVLLVDLDIKNFFSFSLLSFLDANAI